MAIGASLPASQPAAPNHIITSAGNCVRAVVVVVRDVDGPECGAR